MTPAELIERALKPDPKPFESNSFGGDLRGHQALARMCLVRGADVLNPWELGFLESIAIQKRLTTKQAEKLEAIKIKIQRGGK